MGDRFTHFFRSPVLYSLEEYSPVTSETASVAGRLFQPGKELQKLMIQYPAAY